MTTACVIFLPLFEIVFINAIFKFKSSQKYTFFGNVFRISFHVLNFLSLVYSAYNL